MKTKLLLSLLFFSLILPLLSFSVNAENDSFKLGLNAINCTTKEGHSAIYTSKWGKTLISNSLGTNLAWNRIAVFDWDDEKNAYIVTEVCNNVGNTALKDVIIPENGFVVSVNLGNDYSGSGGINYTNKIANETYYALENLEIGMTAYVKGVDFINSKIDVSGSIHYASDFKSNAYIYINTKPEGEIYTPDTSSPKLKAPSIIDYTSKTNLILEKDTEIKWDNVENAKNYYVSVYDSTTCSNGNFTIKNIETTSTSYTIPKGKLKIGCTYTVVIIASADGYRSSMTKITISVVKESALTSIFKDKTVVAYGDSITEMPGWVAMMKSELGTEVINAGVSGDTTILAIKRIEEDVLAHNPDIVIMNFGMNDHAEVISTNQPLVSLRTYENTYRTMIKRILKTGAKIILVTHNGVCTENNFYSPGLYGLDYGADTMHDFFDVVKSLADEFDLGLIDIYDLSVKEGLNKVCLQYDGIHLSTYGQQKYFEWISSYLLENFTTEEDFMSTVSEDISEPESIDESIETSQEISSSSDKPQNNKITLYITIGVLIIATITTSIVIIKRKK